MVAYLDGRLHRIKCPSSEHPGDRSGKNAVVQKMPDGGLMLECHSHHCSYSSIADGLGVEIPRRSRGKASNDKWIQACYDHPDGVPRKVYRRNWPRDFPEAPARCAYPVGGEMCGKSDPHKHIWGSGSLRGTLLLLWGEDEPDNFLAVGEGEKVAAFLMSAGANSRGFTPVSWRGGMTHAEKSDWSRTKDRTVLFLPDNHPEGENAMTVAARCAVRAGAIVAGQVDNSTVELGPGQDAADLSAEDALALLLTRKDLDLDLHTDPDSTEPDGEGKRLRRPPHKTLDEYLIPNASQANDQMMGVRFLRDHGADMVGAYYPTPAKDAQPASDLYRVTETGLLERTDGLVGQRLSASASRYLEDLNPSHLSSGESKVVYGHARAIRAQSAVGKVRSVLDSAHRDIRAHGYAVPGYRHVEAEKVNADLRVLGAPNGVLSLETGKLLPWGSAASKLVSWSVQDDYDPKAQHRDVDKLTEHLESQDAEWLWQAFGFALKGNPHRRVYILKGQPRGGKTTVFDAIRKALATPYASVVPAGSLTVAQSPAGKPSPELLQFVGPRIMVDNEIRGGKLDWALIKMLASGDAQNVRNLNKDYEVPLEPTATLFLAVNETSMPNFGLQEDGMYDRVRILQYPRPKKEDPDLRLRVKEDPAIRQAVVAKLVRYCVNTSAPPEDVANVREAREDARNESIGEAGRWILDNVVLTHHDLDHLHSDSLWTEALLASGEPAEGDKAWGRTKAQLVRLLRDLHSLGSQRAVWGGGRTSRGWKGVRMMTAAEREEQSRRAAAALPKPKIEATSLCRKCGEEFYPDQGEDVCQTCASSPPPPAADSGASDAGGSQPAIDGLFTPSQLSMSAEIERQLTWLAGIEAELRAELRVDPSSGEASMNLDQCAAYRLGIQGFKAANPDFKLNPGHVAELGGAEELLDMIQLAMLKDKTAKAVVENPPDWKGVIGDLHREAVKRQEARRERESRLKPDLLARTQPRLRGI